ncbi:MAG: DUF5106 domain-containing protein [Bacteroidales bacterium]|nr:DUF5106 domain-containing protein [Bacteroidales bacterium]
MKHIGLIIIAASIICACGQNKKNEKFVPVPFPAATIPGMITDQNEAVEYLSLHYWDGITETERTYPSDSLIVSGVRLSDVEQKFADWTSVLSMATPQVVEKSVAKLYDRALACERKNPSSNVFETFCDLTYKYLYDPNSPMRNEDIYYHFVKRLASYEGISLEMRDKYAYDAKMCSLNKVGTVAADFRFADKNGKIRTLHSIEAPVTLLFFSNPGCTMCYDIIQTLSGSEAISERIAAGQLAVLNIYIDEDLEGWRSYMPIYPENWYNGFDPDLVIRTENLYNVRAIPSLYLLDENKKVLFKDVPEQTLFRVLGL